MSDIETVKTTKARTRIQRLLSKIAGNDTPVKVKSKNEILLNEIAENGGSGSGSGGGANVLTLYLGESGEYPTLFKDKECTKKYINLDEAISAIRSASDYEIVWYDAQGEYAVCYPVKIEYSVPDKFAEAFIMTDLHDGFFRAYMYREEGAE